MLRLSGSPLGEFSSSPTGFAENGDIVKARWKFEIWGCYKSGFGIEDFFKEVVLAGLM